MRITRNGLLLSGALTVAAAVAVAGIQLVTPGTDQAAPADNQAAQSVDLASLESVFVPVTAYPEGTTLERLPIQDALKAGMLHPPADVVISPAACTDLLAGAIGDLSKLEGWVQRGETPEQRLVDAYVGTVPGGANLAKLRDQIQQCDNGTVKIESQGLTGTITLTEFAVPRQDGAEAIGIQQTVTFDNAPAEIAAQLEALGSSAQVYMTSGDAVVASCEEVVAAAINHATEMFQNLVRIS